MTEGKDIGVLQRLVRRYGYAWVERHARREEFHDPPTPMTAEETMCRTGGDELTSRLREEARRWHGVNDE